MADSRTHITVICGPTAAGKTAVALEIARNVESHIICADSRQIYQYLDVGTASPTPSDMLVCPHHLFSTVHPAEPYSAGTYSAQVRSLVSSLSSTSKAHILLVGGTGLYITAALDGLSTAHVDTDPDLRRMVMETLANEGREALHRWLMDVDPVAAQRYADKNPRRVQRALEYTLQTGEPFSSTWKSSSQPIHAHVSRFVVDVDKDELNQRINQRCVNMWNAGLVEETQRVLAMGVPPSAQCLQTVGYVQAMRFLGIGEPLTRENALADHQAATRQYAKRQRTWFRKDHRNVWLNAHTAADTILSSLRTFRLAIVLLLMVGTASLWAAPSDSVRTSIPPPRGFVSQYDTVQAIERLSASITSLFRSKPYQKSKVGCRVWNLTRDVLVYEYNPDLNLTPASTTKLFSTAAAFHALGEQGALVTEIRASGRLLPDGTLDGDLYLVGMGDAMLSVVDLEAMADELFAMGVRRVRGKVYGDGSFFDDVGNRAVYSGDAEDVQKLPPVRALTLNEGKLAVIVTASRKGHVSAQVIPASDAVVLKMAPRGKRKRARSKVMATSLTLPDGRQQITVHGTPGPNRTRTVFVAMADPAIVCAGALADRLRTGGIHVDGGVGTRQMPANSRVLVSKRRTLVEFCSVVNKRSHNYFAEQLFKFVGGQYGGKTHTADVARQAMLTTLDSLRVLRRGAVFNDGSGLSRRNLVCGATEVELLRAIHRRTYGDEFKSTLAIAGVDGTIRARMIGTAAENNVYAKTGTLRNTSALAGYVTTLDGEEWAFAILSNGPYTRSYKSTENKIAEMLASFSYGGKVWIPKARVTPIADTSTIEEENGEEFEDLPEDAPHEAGKENGKP